MGLPRAAIAGPCPASPRRELPGGRSVASAVIIHHSALITRKGGDRHLFPPRTLEEGASPRCRTGFPPAPRQRRSVWISVQPARCPALSAVPPLRA